MSKKSLLIVHEDPHVVRILYKMIGLPHQAYEAATSFSEVESHLSHKDFDVILSDINIHGVSRNEYIDFLKHKSQGSYLVIVSSMDHKTIQKKMIKLGAKEFINLPVKISDFQRIMTPLL